MPRASLPSVRQIERLAGEAAGGDLSALTELGNINAKLGRMMNERLRRLERAGETGDSYKRISYNLDQERPRFSQARTGSAEELYRSAMESLKAAGYEKSTLSGIKEAREENIQSLFESLGLSEGERVDKRTVDRMNRFFKSDYWKENRRNFTSGGIEEIAAMAQDVDNSTFDSFMDAINDFQSGDPWYEAVEDWITF